MLSDNEYTEEELDGLNSWFQLEHEKLPSVTVHLLLRQIHQRV